MHLSNEIVLRPRFKYDITESSENALSKFEAKKETQVDFVITRIDDHVFIRIPKDKQHFWSPQLHLEIYQLDGKTKLHGLFGPNPAVWTMFMFLHFAVVIIFIALGIWAYTNYSLDRSDSGQLIGMFIMIVVWIALYISGRAGKKAGSKEMHDQFEFMKETLSL